MATRLHKYTPMRLHAWFWCRRRCDLPREFHINSTGTMLDFPRLSFVEPCFGLQLFYICLFMRAC